MEKAGPAPAYRIFLLNVKNKDCNCALNENVCFPWMAVLVLLCVKVHNFLLHHIHSKFVHNWTTWVTEGKEKLEHVGLFSLCLVNKLALSSPDAWMSTHFT